MREILASIGALYLGVSLLQLGNAMLGTLLAVRMDLSGFPPVITGMIMSGYFIGFTAGTLKANVVVERVGHIRAFAVFAAVLAAATLTHALVVEPGLWVVARAIGGFCVAGLFLVVESWLNERSTPATRGKILSTYFVAVYAAMAAGQSLLALGDPLHANLFVVAAMLMTLALVPVSLTRSASPSVPEPSTSGLGRLYRISPLGIAGAVGSGVILGAFYGLAPVFAQRIGMTPSEIGFFMGTAMLGSLALQWPLGILSDRFDRRRMLIACSFLTALAAAAVIATAGRSPSLLFALTAVYAGFAATIYPLSVAHANDFIAPEDIVAVAGGMLLGYSLGAVVGPLGAAQAVALIGPAGLFTFSAGVSAGLGLFGLWRTTRRTSMPKDEQGPWVALPRTTPVCYDLDPWAEPEAENRHPEAASAPQSPGLAPAHDKDNA
ncbi:MAG: MFS transporter [Kiloniellales bacterium]